MAAAVGAGARGHGVLLQHRLARGAQEASDGLAPPGRRALAEAGRSCGVLTPAVAGAGAATVGDCGSSLFRYRRQRHGGEWLCRP